MKFNHNTLKIKRNSKVFHFCKHLTIWQWGVCSTDNKPDSKKEKNIQLWWTWTHFLPPLHQSYASCQTAVVWSFLLHCKCDGLRLWAQDGSDNCYASALFGSARLSLFCLPLKNIQTDQPIPLHCLLCTIYLSLLDFISSKDNFFFTLVWIFKGFQIFTAGIDWSLCVQETCEHSQENIEVFSVLKLIFFLLSSLIITFFLCFQFVTSLFRNNWSSSASSGWTEWELVATDFSNVSRLKSLLTKKNSIWFTPFGGQRVSWSESGCFLLVAPFPPNVLSYVIVILWLLGAVVGER